MADFTRTRPLLFVLLGSVSLVNAGIPREGQRSFASFGSSVTSVYLNASLPVVGVVVFIGLLCCRTRRTEPEDGAALYSNDATITTIKTVSNDLYTSVEVSSGRSCTGKSAIGISSAKTPSGAIVRTVDNDLYTSMEVSLSSFGQDLRTSTIKAVSNNLYTSQESLYAHEVDLLEATRDADVQSAVTRDADVQSAVTSEK